ncbi:MAG: S8 family peptidase [Gaiella sp.]
MNALRALVVCLAIIGGLVVGRVGEPVGSTRSLASTGGADRATLAASTARPTATSLAPTDPLVDQQWYLARTRALDLWPELPPLAPVRVAVIDSGIDLGHPELAERIVAAKSFVGPSVRDIQGHGTIVAGVIAAELDNGIAIAGLAPSARLVIAKVVAADRSISVRDEARAIRWAVDQGARVINMSLGGVRDPRDPNRDTYSRVEADAIAYAVRKGALVVAAVGNGDQAPREPWGFATYPAALPHVLGVSAIGPQGGVPAFSNRDRVYNDIAAPGVDVLSTFPRALTARRRGCVEQGTTLCAPAEFAAPEGTSFAAPLVSAVAANVWARRPTLRAEQVAAIVQRTARDAKPTSGCGSCPPGRDPLTGWGELDGSAALLALRKELPAPDALEPNDDAGSAAVRLFLPPGTRAKRVKATLDFWDDRDDVYAVKLRRGQRLSASFSAAGAETALALWRPDTLSVDDLARQDLRLRVSAGPGAVEQVSWVATEPGWHFVQLRVTAPVGPVPYRLSIVRSR